LEKIAKKIGLFLGYIAFFCTVLVGIFSTENFQINDLTFIFIKAFVGFIIFWLLGIMVGGFVIKMILVNIAEEQIKKNEENDKLLEGASLIEGPEENIR